MTWPTSNPLAKEMDDRWKESQALTQQWWVQADIDTKMASGQQDCYNQNVQGQLNYRNTQLMFNKMLRILNMIEGYQRDNRLASIMSAADNDPDMGETADQRSTVIQWVFGLDNTYEKISDCFAGSNTCGFNMKQVWMDHREDPENGRIRTQRIPFNAMITDPYWCESDLSDCDWIWTRKYLSAKQLISLYPKIKKDLPSFGQGMSSKDGKFQYLAQNWYQYQQNLYAYDEYWTRDYRPIRKILDTKTGELAEWKGNREQFQLLRRMNPNVELIKALKPTIRWHCLINNHVVYEEKSPYGLDRYPFVPYLCYHFPEVQNYSYRYQGIIRNIRDSQVELNRRRNRLLDILDAQVQSGIMVKEDSLVDPEDAFFQGPGKVMYFKNSANLATDVQPFPAPPVATGWMELIASVEKEIMDIVGPEELFAQNLGNKEMSGVLMKLKMGAGLTGLRNIFDRLNTSQRLETEIIDDLIVNNFGEALVTKILGKPPTQHFFDNEFTRFNIKCEEQELTSTQRQLQFLQAIQLKQLGVPISNKYIMEKSTFSGKKDVIEDIMKQEQMQEQQQMQAYQAEMMQAQMLARSLEAKAQSDFAGAGERAARSIADVGLAKLHASQAVHDRAKGALDNIKALKELRDMDDDRLIKQADFILSMQERQAAMAGGEEGDSAQVAKEAASGSDQAEQATKPQQPQQNPS